LNTEAIVIQILENVIGVKDLGPGARFVDIGGNSLNLVQVLKQIKEKTGAAPSPRMFFDRSRSTVAAISAAIDAQREDSRLAVSVGD
jgi:acyl carrier protein